jgi:D-alanyl-D-alanine carboxypeptidase
MAANPSIKNCVLAVRKGDESLSWAGAAGMASEAGQKPMTYDSPVFLASITKLYTAAAIMLLLEKGALTLDEPMARHLPPSLTKGIHVYRGTDYSDKITTRQLLSHSSGIADYYQERSSSGKSLFELFRENPERGWTPEETLDWARKELTAHFAPGTGTAYSDTNYQLLGKLIESITGEPLHAAFEALIFAPLNLRHTWLVGHPRPVTAGLNSPADVFAGNVNITKIRYNGSYWADGGIISTPGDMIAFLKALNSGKLIRRETLQLMHEWRSMNLFLFEYGLGTMSLRLPWPISKLSGLTPLWGHSGSTGSFLYYSEDLDLYMAGTIDQTESKAKPFIAMGAVMSAVRQHQPK